MQFNKSYFIKIFILSFFILATQSFALQKIRVILDWVKTPNHVPLLYAKSMGYFKEQGLDVELIVPSGATDGPKVVASNHAEIAVTYQPIFLTQIDQNIPLIRFDTLIGQPLESVITLQSGPKTLKDFKHKEVGTSSPGGRHAIFQAMLHSQNISMNQVTFLATNYSLVQALLNHSVDAIIGAMRNYEPLEIESIAGEKYREFYPENYGVPSYDELILVTSVKNKNAPWLKAFVIAHKKALRDMDKNPIKVWNVVIKNNPELDTPLNKKSYEKTLLYFSKHPGSFNAKRYVKFQKFLESYKVIGKGLHVQDYAINPLA